MFIFKNGCVVHQENEIIVVKPFKTDLPEFAIDDKSYPLFETLFCNKAKIVDNVLQIGRSKIKLLSGSITIPTSQLTHSINVDTYALKQAIKFVPSGDSQPVLLGVYVNDLGTIVATDRYRLFTVFNGYKEDGIILPKSFVKEIIKYDIDNVVIEYNTTRAECKIGDDTIYTRLYNGKYPDITPLISDSGYYETNFDLSPYLATGKLVGGDIELLVQNKVITFTGDDTYSVDIDSDIEFRVPLSHYEPVLTCNVDKMLYKANDKPLLFLDTKHNAKIVLVTARV